MCHFTDILVEEIIHGKAIDYKPSGDVPKSKESMLEWWQRNSILSVLELDLVGSSLIYQQH